MYKKRPIGVFMMELKNAGAVDIPAIRRAKDRIVEYAESNNYHWAIECKGEMFLFIILEIVTIYNASLTSFYLLRTA